MLQPTPIDFKEYAFEACSTLPAIGWTYWMDGFMSLILVLDLLPHDRIVYKQTGFSAVYGNIGFDEWNVWLESGSVSRCEWIGRRQPDDSYGAGLYKSILFGYDQVVKVER